MEVQYRLTQEQIGEILAAALSYNNKLPKEVAWNIGIYTDPETGRTGVNKIEALITCEETPLEIPDSRPKNEEMDSSTRNVLEAFRKNRHA